MTLSRAHRLLDLYTAAIVFTVSALLIGFFSTGCASTPAAKQASVNLAISALTKGAALVLDKNPKAVPALRAVSTGIGTVLTQQTLSPDQVSAFVAKIGKDAGLSDAERLVLGMAIQDAHQYLVAVYGSQIIDIENPKIREVLTKAKTSLDQTIALYDVLNK